MLNCSVRLWAPGSTAHRLSTIGADDQAWLVADPSGDYVIAMATRPWRGAADEGAAGVAAPAVALGRPRGVDPAHAGDVLGVLAAFAPARTAGRTQLEATVVRRAKLRNVHALLERR